MSDSAKDTELERKYRVLDQLVSMHSRRRDIFKKRALLLNISLLTSSIVLNAFVFAPDNLFAFANISNNEQKLWIGLTSVAVLVLSIIELKVNFEGTAQDHARAAEKLAALKHEFRSAHGSFDATALKTLSDAYARVFDDIVSIPDREFLRLKAYHLRKVALSKLLSKHPTALFWVLKCKVIVRGTLNMLQDKES
jgi:hypothetical protein